MSEQIVFVLSVAAVTAFIACHQFCIFRKTKLAWLRVKHYEYGKDLLNLMYAQGVMIKERPKEKETSRVFSHVDFSIPQKKDVEKDREEVCEFIEKLTSTPELKRAYLKVSRNLAQIWIYKYPITSFAIFSKVLIRLPYLIIKVVAQIRREKRQKEIEEIAKAFQKKKNNLGRVVSKTVKSEYREDVVEHQFHKSGDLLTIG